MTRPEIDVLWQRALSESVKAGEMFTRYHFAELIRREAVQACIAVCEATEAGDGSHDYNAGCGTMNERIAAALRALLEEPNA